MILPLARSPAAYRSLRTGPDVNAPIPDSALPQPAHGEPLVFVLLALIMGGLVLSLRRRNRAD